MKLIRYFFVAATICALASTTALGQNKQNRIDTCEQENSNVERKEDRFTGEITISLKPQLIPETASNQKLKMALEYKILPKERGRAESFIPKTVNIVFTSASPSRIYDSEIVLVFLIDGERVRRMPGAVHDDYSRLSTEKISTQTIFTGMTIETLERMHRAKTVEMKLGNTEVKFNSETLAAIRLFTKCVSSNN